MIAVTGTVNGVELTQVVSIYADHYKKGYWVKLLLDHKITKVYREDLTASDRAIITAAGRFNQTVHYYAQPEHIK